MCLSHYKLKLPFGSFFSLDERYNMIERFEQYSEIEEQLQHCHQDIDYTLWCKQYGQFFIDLIKTIDKENLNNIIKISHLESDQSQNQIINNVLEKSLLTIMKNNVGITVRHDEKGYIVVKINDELKMLENTQNIPDNQIIKVEQ